MTQPDSSQLTGVVDADALRAVLDDAWERRAELAPDEIAATTRPAVDRAIAGLEQGWLRVAEPDGNGGWRVNEWLKKAVLLYFRTQDMALVDASPSPFWDKVPSRFAGYDEAAFRALGARVVPGAVVRAGTSSEGLPVGVQLVAPPWREEVALAAAAAIETALGGWRPPQGEGIA